MKGAARVLARLFCVNSKGPLRDLPLRIHESVADASAERAARPIAGDGKELKANTRLPSVRRDL